RGYGKVHLPHHPEGGLLSSERFQGVQPLVTGRGASHSPRRGDPHVVQVLGPSTQERGFLGGSPRAVQDAGSAAPTARRRWPIRARLAPHVPGSEMKVSSSPYHNTYPTYPPCTPV
ncbi:unnamed protein product, partial [Ectocarpus sp. 12 AP-2014]